MLSSKNRSKYHRNFKNKVKLDDNKMSQKVNDHRTIDQPSLIKKKQILGIHSSRFGHGCALCSVLFLKRLTLNIRKI